MAKRNAKTKPNQTRVYGETNADDTYVPPDRQDVQSQVEASDMPTEIVDFRKGTTELADEPRGAGGDGGGGDEGADEGGPLREKPQPRQERAVRQQADRGADDDD